MMKCNRPLPTALLLLLSLPAAADLPMSAPMEGKLTASPQMAQEIPQSEPPRPVVTDAVVAEEEQPQPEQQLSEAEKRIRVGIVMLGQLHNLLAGITDEASAEAAVAPIMRTSAEFQAWAQGFSSLPPLDADTQRAYETRYLPIIDELNTRLKIQGERIASAEFYGSKNLPAALVRLVTSML